MQDQSSSRVATRTAARMQIVRIPGVVRVGVGDTDEMQVQITGPQSLLAQIQLEEVDGVLQISGPQMGGRGGSVTNVATGHIGGSFVQARDVHGGVNFGKGDVPVSGVCGPDITDDWAAVTIVVDLPQTAGSAT